MTIGLITNEYSAEGGGLSFSCQQYHRLLEELEHDVILVYSKLDNQCVIQGGYNNRLGTDVVWEDKFKKDSKQLISCSLIIAFGGGFNSYYATLISQKIKARLWVLFRGSDANLGKWDEKLSYYNIFSVKHAEQVCCLSKEISDNILAMVPEIRNVSVIPNFGIKSYSQIKALSHDVIVIGTGAAHLNEKKGVVMLLNLVCCYKYLFQKCKIRLELIGAIDVDVLEQYHSIAKQLNIEEDVEFIGYMNHQAFRNRQKGWDFYVQASVCEGMGNSVVDCMSMGIPIVISNTGYVAEFMNEHFPEIVFKDYSPESMAKSLHTIIHMDELQHKYQCAYDSFFEKISKDAVKKEWERLLNIDICSSNISFPNQGMLTVILHDVQGKEHDNITTPVAVFRKFVYDLNSSGYKLCSMNDYLKTPTKQRNKYIVCTFDDGYSGVFKNALPIMKEFGFTATVFVCEEYIGKLNDWNFKDKIVRSHMSLNELKEILDDGWEIGSHGLTHRSLLRLSDEELVRELHLSKERMERSFGPIKTYAYPYGDFNNYIVNKVKNEYDYAFSLNQGGCFLAVDSFQLKRYFIAEIYKIIGIV